MSFAEDSARRSTRTSTNGAAHAKYATKADNCFVDGFFGRRRAEADANRGERALFSEHGLDHRRRLRSARAARAAARNANADQIERCHQLVAAKTGKRNVRDVREPLGISAVDDAVPAELALQSIPQRARRGIILHGAPRFLQRRKEARRGDWIRGSRAQPPLLRSTVEQSLWAPIGPKGQRADTFGTPDLVRGDT